MPLADNSRAATPMTCWHHTAKHAVHKIKRMAEVSVTSSCYSTTSMTADNSRANMPTTCWHHTAKCCDYKNGEMAEVLVHLIMLFNRLEKCSLLTTTCADMPVRNW